MALIRYFWPFAITLVLGCAIAAALGMRDGVIAAIAALESTIILASLESSQSLDNVVVVSKIVNEMSPRWQRYYQVYGFMIGMIGMRCAMPIFLVALIAWINPWTALQMAIHDPKQYAHILEHAEPEIMTFGGCFLGLLATKKYFLNPERDGSWAFYEKPLLKISGIASMPYFVIMTILIASTLLDAPEIQHGCLISGIAGIMTYIVVQDVIGAAAEGSSERAETGGKMDGLRGLLYVEMIDASFSFDGVISAFAVTTDIVLITLGLMIGAMLTRCFIIANVRTKFMMNLPHLDAGAYTSIWLLSMLMFLKNTNLVTIPDVVTGFIGIVIIGISVVTSIIALKKEKAEQEKDGVAAVV